MSTRKKKKKARQSRGLLWTLLCLALLALLCLGAHMVVVIDGKSHILPLEYDGEKITSGLPEQKVDCILILGAGLWDGYPSPMLQERLNLGAELYFAGASDKILVSGDNGEDHYNEVQAMEDYLVEEWAVPRESIVKDHAGFSTYESMVRAKKIFCVETAIIVTQKYHLFRATYIASRMGIKAYGADAQRTSYSGRQLREARECLARVKDFFYCIFKPSPRYLGEKIPIQS